MQRQYQTTLYPLSSPIAHTSVVAALKMGTLSFEVFKYRVLTRE